MHGSTHPDHARPAVFLDRDDTLNANTELCDQAFPTVRGDLYLPDHVRLLPGVLESCVALSRAGYALVIVTNQACVARGGATLREVEATNDRLRALLTVDGRCLIDAAYIAPHHPEAANPYFRADHPWRKPGPGMVRAASEELSLDPSRSWLVGDSQRDIDAGIAGGVPESRCIRVGPDGDAAGLAEATEFILAEAAPNETARDHADTPPAISALPASLVTLRARTPDTLADPDLRRNIEAAARAIAERTGVRLLALTIEPGAVRATLACSRFAALGFIAELRRSTAAWRAARRPGPGLWHEPGRADA